jgi:hypothetical protein
VDRYITTLPFDVDVATPAAYASQIRSLDVFRTSLGKITCLAIRGSCEVYKSIVVHKLSLLIYGMSAIFEESTQCRFWTYTPESLRLARMTAIASPRTTIVSEREVIMNPKLGQADSLGKNKKPKKLKLKGGEEADYEQEEKVLRHFCRQIQLSLQSYKNNMSGAPIAKKWWRVGPTAIVYFRRFYAHNSLRTHDPRIMVLACILVASKVEESIIDMRELRKIHPKMIDQDVLEAEYRLLKALGAQLHIHHPHNLLQTYVAVVKRAYAPAKKGKTIDIDTIELDSVTISHWLKLSTEYLDLLYVTAAPMLHAPRDLAMAALSDVEKQVHKYEASLVDKSILATANETQKSVVIAAVQTLRTLSSTYLSVGRACVAGEEVASVGAWVKLSKSGWPKSENTASGDRPSVKEEPETVRSHGDGDADEGPPAKRFKQEVP